MNLDKITLLVRQEDVISKDFRSYVSDRRWGAIYIDGVLPNSETIQIAKTGEREVKAAGEFVKCCNDILNQTLAKDIHIWSFVETFYPGYFSDDDILRHQDLTKIVDETFEQGSEAEKILREEFKGEVGEASDELKQLSIDIYERAIQGFIQQHPQLLL